MTPLEEYLNRKGNIPLKDFLKTLDIEECALIEFHLENFAKEQSQKQ